MQQAELEASNEADGPLFKMREDPRVTSVGAFLRRFSLDEIPQLWNVLRGEMSLVGPRPLPLRDYERLEAWHRKRYLVLPGVTGLWQISGRSNLGFDDLVRLDFYYLENWSLMLDVSILVKTIPAVLQGQRRLLVPKILAVASAVDLDFRYGCTPAWWQLWKGLYEAGCDLIVTPYRGRPVESPWWRTEPNPCYREGELFASARDGLARLKRDTHLRRDEDRPPDTRVDRLVRQAIWRWVTPRWQRHLERILERERDVDAVIVFTVPMSHFRGIPTSLRERFDVPVVYYDGDVPMSLPEFGGMDTGFNIYHGADPSEYDLVVSNSEGGLGRLLELGARRAEAVFWGADPELFAPLPVEKERDVFFYGYGDKFRREWMERLIGEPSRRLPDLDFALGGRDFRGDVGRARLLGDIPFNAFNRAISASRINLNVTRRSHATVEASSTAGRSSSRWPARRSSRARSRGSSAGSSRDESCWSSPTRTRPSRPIASCSPIPARAKSLGGGRASGHSTSTPTSRGRGDCSRWSAWTRLRWRSWRMAEAAQRVVPAPEPELARRRRLAIVPAYNEERTIERVIEEIRAFDPGFEIVVVDDGSVDSTAFVAERAGAHVLRLPFNLGIGGAVQAGYQFARDYGFDLAVQVDGDGQHDPREIAALVEPILAGRADMVVGTRFAAGGGYQRHAPTPRRDPPLRRARLGARPAARDRHHLRFPGREPQGDPPLRRRVPARLPRGRGDGGPLPAPAADGRGAGGDADPRDRQLLDHRASVGVLHGQGAARPLHRALSQVLDRAGGTMTPFRVSIAAGAAAIILLLVILELIRSRRLQERYALLWLLTGIVILVLSAWRGALSRLADLVGIAYPPSALFVLASLFVLVVLLHYSTVISKLSDQNRILAQRLALLEHELKEKEGD